MKTLRELHASRKTFNTEEYYKKRWNEFLENPRGRDHHVIASCYMNLEAELDRYVSTMHGRVTPEQIEMVRKAFAPEVAHRAYAKLKENQKVVNAFINGETSNSWGIEFNKYRERFEFNCLQLREFMAKYGVTSRE